ncbi:unnamed protein product [Callosobruchus maculatus]|uniref:GST C-terminal domain-containing protein n=1 Tax=Callosobruchus maculatus TaxID=64391 RepID=A0A653BLF5_CALMS|nr:unnamed protein product [Callosobruchus maculatus]
MLLDFSLIEDEGINEIESPLLSGVTQEPWPKDVKLYQPYELNQILLPDHANCLAVKTFLRMCHLNYEVVYKANAEAMSPTLKVPFIKAGQFVVANLEGIVQFVNGKGIMLTEKLDNEQKADMRAFMSLIHNVIENAELHICWADKLTYNRVTRVRHGSVYPWPLSYMQNWEKRSQVIKKLKALDWYNKTLDDVFAEVEACCEALNTRLDGKRYFFEEGPTELDALAFGHLSAILKTSLPRCELVSIVKKYPQLVDLVQRIRKEYF